MSEAAIQATVSREELMHHRVIDHIALLRDPIHTACLREAVWKDQDIPVPADHIVQGLSREVPIPQVLNQDLILPDLHLHHPHHQVLQDHPVAEVLQEGDSN
jgi:hypothetical protein